MSKRKQRRKEKKKNRINFVGSSVGFLAFAK